jgi:hypothetical protein
VASGNIDLYTTPNITLKVGGSIDFNDRKIPDYTNSMFNYVNNGEEINKTWRVFGRFTQRFNNATPDENEQEVVCDFKCLLQHSGGLRNIQSH